MTLFNAIILVQRHHFVSGCKHCCFVKEQMCWECNVPMHQHKFETASLLVTINGHLEACHHCQQRKRHTIAPTASHKINNVVNASQSRKRDISSHLLAEHATLDQCCSAICDFFNVTALSATSLETPMHEQIAKSKSSRNGFSDEMNHSQIAQLK